MAMVMVKAETESKEKVMERYQMVIKAIRLVFRTLQVTNQPVKAWQLKLIAGAK